jgi:hypothetical protein
MIVGNPNRLAIEHGITKAYEMLGARALGYFLIHIAGKRYGVCKPDASLLACSFDEVKDRILRRGTHVCPFELEPDPAKIAGAIEQALYGYIEEDGIYFGIPAREISNVVYANHLLWAPDGDEAFDDLSRVLHFDVGHRVRLIGFRCLGDSNLPDPASLSDIWLDTDEFYNLLGDWRDKFEAQWKSSPKVPENGDLSDFP